MTIKLMVIMASPSMRKIFRLAFPPPDFEILELQERDDAIRKMGSFQPHALFLDISERKPDPYDYLEKLNVQTAPSGCHVFLFPGAYASLDQDRIKRIEYSEIVYFPFDSRAFAARIRRLFDPDVIESLPEEPVEEDVFYDKSSEKQRSPLNRETWKDRLKKEILDEVRGVIEEDRLKKSK